MDCPKCKTADAYLGFTEIQCVSPSCEHFSQELLSELLRKAKEKENEATVSMDSPDMLCCRPSGEHGNGNSCEETGGCDAYQIND